MTAGRQVFFLIRHGDCELGDRYIGCRSDVPLTRRGREQGEALALWAAGLAEADRPVKILTSPMLRAVQTAAYLERGLNLTALTEPGFRELDFGLWDGLSWEEITRRWPAEAESWARDPRGFPPPGGQTSREFFRIVDEAWDGLTEPQPDGEPAATVLVTHGGVIRRILARILGLPDGGEWHFRCDRGSASVISRTDGYWVLETLNYRPGE